ncbi:uncharacterized protein TA08245 [Theileria annulata]|uniref:DNA topoisomerase (ATP-hydrolyzing) n=1 Tax=Theileria annulata TaxID=5874 RepID=Q4U9R2_THEAN|nr:uncharacterized protein TA08245 [Theileria annulata]CAI76441.1 hypothetical protein, conserved [Theileria annulata]|eukprot:XP_953066.1 hypothetical protein, conserved [Theileria annulata]
MTLYSLESYFISLLEDLINPNFSLNSSIILYYTRVILVLFHILRNLRSGTAISLRGIYYNCAHIFQSQQDSNQTIAEITQRTRLSRKDLLIISCPKSLIKGHLTISEIFNQHQIINSNCISIFQIVEKETVYHRLLKFGLIERLNKLNIIINIDINHVQLYFLEDFQVFPSNFTLLDYCTRELVHKIYQKSNNQFPFIILTDINPSGLNISLNFFRGPRKLSYYFPECGIENLYWMYFRSEERISGIKSVLTSRDLRIIENLIYELESENIFKNNNLEWIPNTPNLIHLKNTRKILEKFISEGFTYQLDDLEELEELVTESLNTLNDYSHLLIS